MKLAISIMMFLRFEPKLFSVLCVIQYRAEKVPPSAFIAFITAAYLCGKSNLVNRYELGVGLSEFRSHQRKLKYKQQLEMLAIMVVHNVVMFVCLYRKALEIIEFLIERKGPQALEFGQEAKSVVTDALNMFSFWNATLHKVSVGKHVIYHVIMERQLLQHTYRYCGNATIDIKKLNCLEFSYRY